MYRNYASSAISGKRPLKAGQSQTSLWTRACVLGLVALGCLWSAGCARLPYTTQTVHQDSRVVVTLQHEVQPAGYSHPIQFRNDDLSAILAAFSFREKQRLPLRWFAEERPPKQIFRSDEIHVLAPHLIEALQKAGPDERIHFEVLAPGMNPAYERDVTAGWMAVREPYLHFTLEHFHSQFPIRKEEQWDLRYPAIPPEPGTFLLYFEPGRFWVTDPIGGERVLQFREFLKSAIVPPGK
jgi:hypothetical protein